MKRLTTIFNTTAIIVSFISITGLISASPVLAASFSQPLQVVADAKGDACAGIGLTGAGCTGAGAQTQANTLVSTAVNLFAVLVGVAAVVMIMIAGLKYTTSGGDPSKIASAKTTLIYALVGLVVVAAAETIVRFVLGNA
jgi:hypothetical protein